MSSMGKKKKGPALMTKVLKKKKLRRAKKKVPPVPLIPGTKIVVETLSTNTKANVVWQDGSVEFGINNDNYCVCPFVCAHCITNYTYFYLF